MTVPVADWIEKARSNKHKLLPLFLGQVLSLCITGTSTASSALWKHHGISIPFTQNFCNYLLLAIVYNSLSRSWSTKRNWLYMIQEKSLILWLPGFGYSLADVQANVLAVLAFKNTSVLSALIVSSWTLPCIMLLSTLCLGARYRISHFLAVFLCLCGLAILIYVDTKEDDGSKVNHSWIGDLICLLSASLYAVSNVAEEYLVNKFDTQNFLALAGFWGSLLCGGQALIFEYEQVSSIEWSWPVVGLIGTYVLCLFTMYSLVPTLYRWSGAIFMSMSLTTSNFYSLLIGLFFLESQMPPFYPVAYILVIGGVTLYNLAPSPHQYADYQPL
ncbi:solute carrier family 35 member SLC35F1/F2/F6 [Radiomyces spectabilis]|uniref:solute carrier family 35 member SLC35F1/F2/F6 n=1 Tax=Radiomyces spectabilis TaxID=64574 RepID=UPI00221FD970|nr:solute carrier family 35 member SLC35F1/F2/F6 [Radiomyces spectabilis]KAI8377454.1 solute carrier family 35 member SLC35F1/F2/F6 [Radiomyces spectabilis]